MRDFKFDSDVLFHFSQSDPYHNIEGFEDIWNQLNNYKIQLNFPAVHNDVGSFISFLTTLYKPKIIFEMGSGYGQSAFWYLLKSSESIKEIILTEKRTDLEEVFYTLPWPKHWTQKMKYHQGDAFDRLKECGEIHMALIDGVKGDYLRFLKELYPKLCSGGIVLIDNSYWRGSFLDDEIVKKKSSAKKIRELHEYIKHSNDWSASFIPFKDGLTILTKV